MWRNWNPLNPPVNEQSSEDENNYESPNGHDPSELVSPQRPHQSASASPRALLRPDPPPVGEVLQRVDRRLRELPTREQRVANRNAHRQAQEAAEAAAAAAAAEARRQPAATMAEPFDVQDGVDGDKAQEYARGIRIEFNASDVKFWFSQLEGEMLMATVKSQWLKKTILQRNLPTKQKEDVKALLMLEQAEAGSDIYKKIKAQLCRIYAPRPCDSYRKALTRQMIGLPSQLGHQIVDDICKKPTKLTDCCCAAAAQALWSIQLPVNVHQHISNLEFTAATYKDVFEAADQCYLSAKQVAVAAVATPLDETLPAFDRQNQPQVAAVNRGGNGGQNPGKGNKNNKGNRNNRGQPKGRPKRHPSNPSEDCCDRHYQYADKAWFCTKPLTCPLVNKVADRA